MQRLHQNHSSLRLSRCSVAIAVGLALLAMPSSDLHAQESEGPEFKFDPDKALIFKPDPKQSHKPISTQCLSSDGKMRAEAGFRKVSVYSVPDDKLLHEVATPNRVAAPTFSPDLKTLAFADCAGNLGVESVIYTLELETGKHTKIGSCYGPIIRLAFSGDGKRLVGASVYGLMTLAAKLQLQRDIHGEVAVFDVSSQQDLLRMAYVLPERISPENAERLLRHVPTHIALDHDGSTLLLASTSGLIKVIDVETGDNRISIKLDGESAKPEKTPETGDEVSRRDELDQLLEESEKEWLIYSHDKKLLAHLDRRKVTVWSVEERRRLHQFVLEGRPLAAAFSPDGGSLVTADGEGNLEYRSTIKLWSLAKGESRLIAQFLGSPTHFSFSPDGRRLAAASNLNLIGSITRNPEGGITPDRIQTGGSIHVWRVSDGSELLKVDIELPEYTAKLIEFQRVGAEETDFNKDKATDALQTAYDAAVRKRVPYRLNFSPDGERLITMSKSGEETIFDSQTGKPLRPTSRGEKDGTDHPAKPSESTSEDKKDSNSESTVCFQ